ADVAAHRNALTGGPQVSLGGDSVLVVAEIVADVRQHLDQHDADIGDVRLLPVRHSQREAIENQLAKAAVVFSEIVDLRVRARWRRALGRLLAIEVGRAPGAEIEDHGTVERIEAVHRLIGGTAVLVELYEAERVIGEVAGAVDTDFETVVECRVFLPEDSYAG